MKNWLIAAVIIFLLGGCQSSQKENDVTTSSLKLIAEFELAISEASGICWHWQTSSLLVVSDNTSEPYQLQRFSTGGEHLQNYDVQGYDLEAAACSKRDSSIWLADESCAHIFPLDNTEAGFMILSALDGNSGLEGLTFRDSLIYAVKEKNPVLLYSCDMEGNISKTHQLDFLSDCSDIVYNESDDCFWLLSDQDQKIYIVNDDLQVLQEYELDIPKPEGIALSPDGNIIYIVSDENSHLYIFNKT